MPVIATALTLASLGAQAYGSYNSFSQASEASRLKRQAEADAEKAMSNAKKLIQKNEFKGLAIAKEAYRQQQEASNITAAQAIEALRESDRGTGRLGGVYAQKQMMDADIAARMGGDIYDLNLLKAKSLEQESDTLAGIELQEKAGQELLMSDLDRQYKEGTQGGISALGNIAAQGVDSLDTNFGGKVKANMAERRALRSSRKAYNDSIKPFDSINPFDPINFSVGRNTMPDMSNPFNYQPQYFDPRAQLINNASLGLGQQQITGLSGQSNFSN